MTPNRSWSRLVLVATVTTAAADLAAMALQRSVIPPVLIGAVLSLAVLPLLSRRPRLGLGAIGGITLLLLVTGAPFALPPLAHPDSPIGFTHAAAHIVGRVVLLVAVVGAWVSQSPRAARLAGGVAATAAAGVLLTAAVATAARPDATARPGDVLVVVKGFELPRETVVPAGATLFVRNDDTVWHRVAVTRTPIDRNVAAGTGIRVPVDAAPGDYALYCDITGHESMAGRLTVTAPAAP